MADELAELRARCERLALLYQVSQVIHSTLEPEEALRLILREAVRLMRAASGSVVLVNPTTDFLEIQAAHGLPSRAHELRLRVGEGVTGWVARTGQAARVGDVRQDARYIMVRPEVRSELAVPVVVNGEVRGVINVDADRAEAFSVEDQQLLEELASQAAVVIRHTWLYEQLRLKVRLFESLASVSQTINSALNLDEALQGITREAAALMNARLASVRLVDETGEWLDLRAHSGAGSAYLARPRLALVDSLLGTVVRRKKSLQVENVQTSSRYQSVEVARQEGLVSLLSVPLVFRSQAIGTLNVYTGDPHSFSNEEIRILTALAELSAIAIEKARLYERVVNAEEQLRQAERLSALGLLAAEVAHEIRNPLAVMKLLYHSLDLRFGDGDPRNRDAQVMGEKMDQLNRLVERVLDFARSTEPKPAQVQVNRLIDDLTLLTRHKLRQQQVVLECRLGAELPLIRADATQLEQAFLNLTLNAVEAMPQGGTLTIVTRPVRLSRKSAAATHVSVSFRDTGGGMTEEQRRRAFTSLLSTTKPKGTGLGLALVAKIVEAHGGRARVRSRLGVGTQITLVLPV
ncbi:MAG: GAF domain-containing protein [Verrucomicrobia bacterium]|nr:GAF domain-containing protein [Verrucomicrobiota bacterium]